MTKARELANLGNAYSDGALSNRNLIINGAMQVAQRSPLTGLGNPSAYTLDRWYLGRDGGTEAARFTVTKETLTSSDSPFTTDGHSFAMKLDVTTASGGIGVAESHYMMQRIEGQNASQLAYGSSNGKTCTVSFWLKTDAKTGTMSVGLYHAGAYSYIQEISVTTTWTKYELEFPADTVTGFTADNSNGLQLMFTLSGGSSKQTAAGAWTSGFYNCTSNQADFTDSTANNIYFTGVQLEVGDTATPFEHRSYGDELQRCQRYYYQVGGVGGFLIGGYTLGNADDYNSPFAFPVTMRIAPSITVTGTWFTFNTTTSSPSVGRSTSYAATVYAKTSASGNWYMDAKSADDLIKFDAEL